MNRNLSTSLHGGIAGPVLLCLSVAGSAASLSGQVTFAGTQVVIAGSASESLSAPSSVAVDGKGNVYIADQGNDRILMVASNTAGYELPVPLSASLSRPVAVASDWAGNVFIADTGNNRIVMLPMTANGPGAATTIATGLSGPSGVAVDSNENVYVSDTDNNQVVELPYVNGNYGTEVVVSTGFNHPTQITVDSKKTLYIADTGNNHIIKELLTSSGYATKQILGVGTLSPMGVAVDGSFDMYTADTGHGDIVESTWNVSGRFNKATIVGGGFISPAGMVADGSGGVYVADSAANRVVDLVPSSVNFGAVTVGTAAVFQTYQFEVYAGMTIGSVGIYTEGVAGKDFNDGGGSSCIANTYTVSTLCVVNVSFTPLGSGQRNGSISIFDPSGNPLATAFISGSGIEPQVAFFPGTVTYLGTGLSGPSGVAVDGNGDVFISDTGNDRVVEIASNGDSYQEQTTFLEEGISSPMGLAVDGADNLYVVSNGNDKVVKIPWLGNAYGAPVKVGSGLYGPTNVAVDSLGNVYISDTLDSRVWKVAWTGNSFANEQKFGDYVHFPVGVAVDPAGDLYFTSPYQNNLAMLPAEAGGYNRQVNTTLQNTSFPSAIAVDGNSNLYVLDTANNKVVMIPWTGASAGKQITIATGFNQPSGMTLDSNGNLYVADTGNNQVVKIDFSIPGPLNFASVYVGSSSAKPLTSIVQNIGNQPLTLASISYPADFPQASGASACGAGVTLGQGSSCAVTAACTPLSANPQLVESVTIVDNAFNVQGSTQTILMTGTGTGESSQAITFPPLANPTYGVPAMALAASASSGLPVSYQVISGPGTVKNGQYIAIGGAGVIVVQATQPGSGAYQAAAPVTLSFTVTPALLTLTPSDVGAVYGSVPSSFRTTITGFVFGQSSGQVVSGAPIVTSSGSTSSGVGTYTLSASVGSLVSPNYTFAFAPGILTISPALLNVSAVPVSTSYGKPLPTLAWTIAGLRNGDTASAVLGSPTLSTTATLGSPVGAYSITPSLGSLTAANYTFQFTSASLAIVPALLTVSADNKTTVYGASIPSPTYTFNGFLAGDSQGDAVSGMPTLALTAKSGAAVGTYAITLSAGTLTSSKYKFVLVNGSLTVQKALLSVTPANQTAAYGSTLPALTYTVSGYVMGDTAQSLSGLPRIIAGANSSSPAGVYSISASPGSLSSANYSFVFVPGVMTISPAVLTISALPVSTSYGQALPTFSWAITGWRNGDSATVVSGSPLLTTAAKLGSPVGAYPISMSLGSLSAANYTFQFNAGSLTVLPAMLTITADSKTLVYGAPVPALTFAISGFVNGDAQGTSVQGNPALNAAARLGSPVGTYGIAASAGTLTSRNYQFTFVNGALTIHKAVLSVTPIKISTIYGQSTPALTYTISGFVNDDTAHSVSGVPQLTSTAATGSPAGLYSISASLGTLSAENYSFQYSTASLTILQATLTLAADNKTITYGEASPALTYTMSGFFKGDSESNSIKGAPVLRTTAKPGSPTGTYGIELSTGTLTSNNYHFALVSSTMIIQKAILSVAPANSSMTYGQVVPTLTYSLSGFVNGDNAGSIGGQPMLIACSSKCGGVGTYSITASAGSLKAANYSFTFDTGTIMVKPATLTVTPLPVSMIYGQAAPAILYTVSGFANGDKPSTVNGVPTFTDGVTRNSPVGAYPIVATTGSLTAKNYIFRFEPGQLKIAPAELTLSAANADMTYGSQAPLLTYTVIGLVAGDTPAKAITGFPSITTAATKKSPAGVYVITSSVGTIKSKNYLVQFKAGVMTVNRAPLMIEADDFSMKTGAKLPPLTCTVTGLVNGDTAAQLGTASLSTTATAKSVPGSYVITAAKGTIKSSNYTFTLRNGTLTVTQ